MYIHAELTELSLKKSEQLLRAEASATATSTCHVSQYKFKLAIVMFAGQHRPVVSASMHYGISR